MAANLQPIVPSPLLLKVDLALEMDTGKPSGGPAPLILCVQAAALPRMRWLLRYQRFGYLVLSLTGNSLALLLCSGTLSDWWCVSKDTCL